MQHAALIFKGIVERFGNNRFFRLDLEGSKKQIETLIQQGNTIQGVRFWMLMASCLIASIGLNTNSTAVIIGAMLISPLMGPILGLGYGMAMADQHMMRTTLLTLVFAILASLVLASCYFVVSPFQDATQEILSRTSPNLLDLLVAAGAAFAGVVAMNSKSLSGAVPGVAIATAIMPPLCASAYGIAHANWKIAFGAFYLFFVNAFAIALVSYVLFKRMYAMNEVDEPGESRKFRSTSISIAIFLVVSSLTWSLWDTWRSSFEDRSITRFVEEYRPKLDLINWHWEKTEPKKLVLYNWKVTPVAVRHELEVALRRIHPKALVEFHENALSPEMESWVNQLKTSPVSALISNPKIMEGLLALSNQSRTSNDLMNSVLRCEADLQALVAPQGRVRGYIRSQSGSNEVIFTVEFQTKNSKQRYRKEVGRYAEWIRTKLPAGTLVKVELL